MLTGKLLTAICAIGVFIVYGPAMIFTGMFFREQFLPVIPDYLYNLSLRELFRCTSPWAFCLSWGPGRSAVRVGITGAYPETRAVGTLVAVTVLFIAAAALLYRIRRTEAAGNAVAFSKLEPVIKLFLTIPSAVLAGALALSTMKSDVWAVAFIVGFGVLTCMIMEFVYRWDIWQALRHKSHLVITCGAGLLIFFGLRFDVLKINRYVPDREDVVRMAVLEEFPSITYYISEDYPAVTGNYDSKEILDYLTTDCTDSLYEIACAGARAVQEGVLEKLEDDTYVWSEEELTTWVGIKYQLKNGRTLYRRYPVPEMLLERCMDEVLQDREMRERYFQILSMDQKYISSVSVDGIVLPDRKETESQTSDTDLEEDKGEMEITDSWDSGWIQVDNMDRETVLSAYRQDLQTIGWEAVRDADGMLNIELKIPGRDNIPVYCVEYYPLSEAFRHTMEALSTVKLTEY